MYETPLTAAAMRPKPGRSRYGPVWPKAEIRTMTRPRLTAWRSSQPSFQRSMVPGRKFSARMSAWPASRRMSACPSGARRLQVMDFLFRDSASHQYESPSAAGVPSRRRSSPVPGCSTLMTPAPNSPSKVQQNGAATKVARSRTMSPSRAPRDSLIVRSSRHLRPGVLPALAEVQALDPLVCEELCRRAHEGHAAHVEHVAHLGDLKRPRGLLLDHGDGETRLLELDQLREDQIHVLRREPEGGLVEQQHLRARHEAAPDGQHLLLAARHGAGELPPPAGENRKERQHPVQPVADPRGLAAEDEGADLEVLQHGHGGEHETPLGDIGEAAAHAAVSRLVSDGPRLHEDLALPRTEETHERLERGGLAGAVGPDDARDGPAPDGQVHAANDGDLVVARDEPPRLEDGVAHYRLFQAGIGSTASAVFWVNGHTISRWPLSTWTMSPFFAVWAPVSLTAYGPKAVSVWSDRSVAASLSWSRLPVFLTASSRTRQPA